MKLQLAWFSPVVPQPTDIANYTERLRPHLDAEFDVRYFTETESGFLDLAESHRYDCDPGQVPSEIFRELNSVDLPVYHIGNNPRFHLNTLFLSRRKPGLVVLHDRKLHHFFDAVYKHRLGDRETYVGLMRKYYGALGGEAAAAAWEAAIPIDFMADYFPLTQVAIENALAVIVHTKNSLDYVRGLTSTPVFRLPLAFPAAEGPLTRQQTKSADEKVRLVLFGFLGPNRRVTEFLHALARMHERNRFVLDLAGEMGNFDEVKTAVRNLELEGSVTLHGYAQQATLDDLLWRADLAINLRYPSMGEASGTQLRIWSAGLPSLVTQTEGYSELPGECVCFVRPDHEEADIQRHLRNFLADPLPFRRQGENAKILLEREHSPVAYVRGLRDIAKLMGQMRQRRTKCDLAKSVGRVVAPVEGASDRSAIYAQKICELFEGAA
ncbi:MAG: glycosyltransferase [Chthoniobacterales bacterium]|nr:glycosyltransferase [Chthoniobacterales bacterium]